MLNRSWSTPPSSEVAGCKAKRLGAPVDVSRSPMSALLPRRLRGYLPYQLSEVSEAEWGLSPDPDNILSHQEKKGKSLDSSFSDGRGRDSRTPTISVKSSAPIIGIPRRCAQLYTSAWVDTASDNIVRLTGDAEIDCVHRQQ